jgi:hypothetical protein
MVAHAFLDEAAQALTGLRAHLPCPCGLQFHSQDWDAVANER